MLGFRNFIYGFLMKKIVDPYFFLSGLCPVLDLCPFAKIAMKYCKQNTFRTIRAIILKLNMLIGDDE